MKTAYVFTFTPNVALLRRWRNLINFMGGFDPDVDYLVYTMPGESWHMEMCDPVDFKRPNVKLREIPIADVDFYEMQRLPVSQNKNGELMKLFVAKPLIFDAIKQDYDVVGFLDVDIYAEANIKDEAEALYASEAMLYGNYRESHHALYSRLLTKAELRRFPEDCRWKINNGFLLYNCRKFRDIPVAKDFLDFIRGREKYMWCSEEVFYYNLCNDRMIHDPAFNLTEQILRMRGLEDRGCDNPKIVHFGSTWCPFPIEVSFIKNPSGVGVGILSFCYFRRYMERAEIRPMNYGFLLRHFQPWECADMDALSPVWQERIKTEHAYFNSVHKKFLKDELEYKNGWLQQHG